MSDLSESSEDESSMLDDYVFQMGPARGRLAAAIDLLTDAEVLLARHRIYTHAPTNRPHRDADVDAAIARLTEVRKHIATALEAWPKK